MSFSRMTPGFADEAHEWAFFKNAPVPVAYVGRDGEFLRVNEAWTLLVGYSYRELEDRTFQLITHPDDVQADTEEVERCLRGEQDEYAMVKKYLHKSGYAVNIHLFVRAVRDDDGEVIHFISWAVPLPNHGKFKVEKSGDDVYVRPVFHISDFIRDNWKVILPWFVAFSWFFYRIARAFEAMMEQLKVKF